MSAITREEAEKFLSLVNAGQSQSAAAREIGRDRACTVSAAIAFGLIEGRLTCRNDPCGVTPAEMLDLHKQGLNVDAIASRTGISQRTVRDKLGQARREERIGFFKHEEKPEKPKAETRGPWPAGHDVTWKAISSAPWPGTRAVA